MKGLEITQGSMRRTLLVSFGGTFKNMWDIPKFDYPWVESRGFGPNCKKDSKSSYRPYRKLSRNKGRHVDSYLDECDWFDYEDLKMTQRDYQAFETTEQWLGRNINHTKEEEEQMGSITYSFSNDHQVTVPESIDMSKYIEAMSETGIQIVQVSVEEILLIEPKVLPDTMACGKCGDIMELISSEDGYDCSNPECALHMAESDSTLVFSNYQ